MSIVERIRNEAGVISEQSKGTPAEEIAHYINTEVQNWVVESQKQMSDNLDNLIFSLKAQVPSIPENNSILAKIEEIKNYSKVEDQLAVLTMIIPLIPTMAIPKKLDSIKDKVDSINCDVGQLVTTIKNQSNPQEYLNTIQQNLEDIKDEIPGMKKQIDDVLYELYSPAGIDQKLKVAIPIIPLLATYEVETNPSKFVADRIFELRKLVMGTRK